MERRTKNSFRFFEGGPANVPPWGVKCAHDLNLLRYSPAHSHLGHGRGGCSFASCQKKFRAHRAVVVALWCLVSRDAVAGRVRFGDLFATAHYDSLRLQVDGALRLGGKPALQASASLPLDLALMGNRTRQLNEPLTGRIATAQADLTLLESVFPDVTRARGTLFTDVALTGTWDRPRLRGEVRLDSASLSLDNLGIRLDHARADIGLFGDSILIRRIRATTGSPQDSIGISGAIGIREIANPTFDLRLAAHEFQAVDKPRTASIVMTTTTPITLIAKASAEDARKILTRPAIMMPIRPMIMKLPKRVRSALVV